MVNAGQPNGEQDEPWWYIAPMPREVVMTYTTANAQALDSANQRIAALEAALAQIRAEVEPVRTRRVRRNDTIKAICDAALTTRAGADAGEGEE